MKKLFLLFALMGMVAIGCTKDEVDKDDNENKTEQPNDNEGGNKDDFPESIFFGLDKESVTISPDGGSVDVIVYSNYKWEISGASDWCAPSITKGEPNEDGQKVTFSADLTYDDREAIFWFRCADEKIKFVVLQKLKAVIIPDANNSFTIPAEGGVAVLSYKTSVDCDVIIPEDAQDWITIAPATRGLVSENVNLEIAENTTYAPRSAVIKVIAKDNTELVVEYTINQEQKPTYSLYYTSSDGKIVEPYKSSSFDATILSNTYKEGVGEIEFNAPITKIGSHAFYGCSSLTSVTIPDSVTTIGNYAFYGCSSLTSVTIPDSVTMIGLSAFKGCSRLTNLTIGDSVTTIDQGAFEYCSSLTSVTIPDSVSKIKGYAFANCSSLTSVSFGDSVTEIGSHAFSECSSLISVSFGYSVTEIGYAAFEYCSSLTNITIPDSVTTIGKYAFEYCSSLTSVSFGDSVTEIGSHAFYVCSSLTSVTIPDSVTKIGDNAFCGCSSLTSLSFGDSITEIGEKAFYGCTGELIVNNKIIETNYELYPTINGWLYGANFTRLTIGDGVTKIGENAFNSFSSLTSVTIPDSVTKIGDNAFFNCLSLTSVYCKAITPPSMGSYVFYYNEKDNIHLNNDKIRCNIYVPMASVSKYKESGWWKYAERIVGYNF